MKTKCAKCINKVGAMIYLSFATESTNRQANIDQETFDNSNEI